MSEKKTFKETKIGAFLSSKAPKVLAALGDVLPNQGTLGVVKNLITSDNKIKFSLGNMKLISKVIDGKFPDYKKVVPTNNEKTLVVSSKEFINSIERVASVSLDRKEGVKLIINKDNIQLSVNSANSGEGNEKIKADFNSENLNISFNSKYLIDISSEVEDKNLKMNLKDSVSPVLIEDASDKNSYYVIMPMKI